MRTLKTLGRKVLLAILCLLVLCLADTQADIKVYDANGQYLGIVSSASSICGVISVYVPSISCIITLNTATGECDSGRLHFQTDDCTGTPYVDACGFYRITKIGEKYYIGERVTPIKTEMHSELDREGNCRPYDEGNISPWYYVPAREISAEEIPFTLPVPLPLTFEYAEEPPLPSNEPPQIRSFRALPTRGRTPLRVLFYCNASDPDGSVVEYRWDFNGDGTPDASTTRGHTIHTYTDPGTYNATCTPVDDKGAFTTSDPVIITVIEGHLKR